MIWKRKSRGDLATPWAARRSEFLLGVERFGLKAGWAVVVQAATSDRRMSPLLSRLTMLAACSRVRRADLVHLVRVLPEGLEVGGGGFVAPWRWACEGGVLRWRGSTRRRSGARGAGNESRRSLAISAGGRARRTRCAPGSRMWA